VMRPSQKPRNARAERDPAERAPGSFALDALGEGGLAQGAAPRRVRRPIPAASGRAAAGALSLRGSPVGGSEAHEKPPPARGIIAGAVAEAARPDAKRDREAAMKMPEFELERYFARHEFGAPYLLSSSDMETMRVDELLALADGEGRRMWEDLALGYTESQGHPLLREEIASLYETVPPEGVLVFSGAEEAIFALASVVAGGGPGRRAAVVWPAYQSLHEVARSAGAAVDRLELKHEEGWALDPDALGDLLGPSTDLVVLNFPHNPTGSQPDRETFARAVSSAGWAGATVLSDEVYRLLEHDPADRLPAAADLHEGAASLGVMSKSFGLAGLRIGWLATRDLELLSRVAAFKDYTTICNSAPSEVLALIALRAKEEILGRNRGIVLENLPLADAFFEKWRGEMEWVRPRVGCIGFPRLLADVPAEAFAAELVEEEGVMLLPGSVYGHPANHFRLGLGRRNFPEALERLDRFAEERLA
jgi:aspartate/methionine/tyrosine aminotransferase